MSEEDAALFWEVDSHPTPSPEDNGVEPKQTDRTIPAMQETVPENTTVTGPVPNEKPEDPQCTGMCNRPVSDSQDPKPADSARLARMRERTGVLAANPVTPGSPCLQATTGTQTDGTIPTWIETLKENGAPETLKETVTPGPEQPVDNKHNPEAGEGLIQRPRIGMSLS